MSEGGLNVVYGDFLYIVILLKVGIDKVDLFVIIMMDFEIIKKIVYVVRSNSKNILIVIVLFDGIIIESIKEDLKVFFEVDLNIDYVIIFMDVIRDVFLVVIYCIGEKKNLNFFFKKLREFREFVDILGIIMYDNLDLDLIVSVMVLVVIV